MQEPGMNKDQPWAVVAGATGSLGRAIALKLASKGLRVLAIARTEAALAELAEAAPNIVPCAGDMGSNEVSEIIAARVDGPVRIAVQAVGLPIRRKDQAFDPNSLGVGTNLKVGGFLRLVAGVDARLQPGSRLVALGGYHGFEPDPTATGPGVINAGLANLIRQLSIPYGKKGVSVHLVSPGPVDTDRIRKLADDSARIRGLPAETILDEWRNESSFGRLITTDQVAWMVGLLLDPEADSLHGSVIHMDGGRRKGIV